MICDFLDTSDNQSITIDNQTCSESSTSTFHNRTVLQQITLTKTDLPQLLRSHSTTDSCSTIIMPKRVRGSQATNERAEKIIKRAIRNYVQGWRRRWYCKFLKRVIVRAALQRGRHINNLDFETIFRSLAAYKKYHRVKFWWQYLLGVQSVEEKGKLIFLLANDVANWTEMAYILSLMEAFKREYGSLKVYP